MTKAQRKARAKRAGAVRRKANAVKAFMKRMNPGKKAPVAVRVKRLKGGGISVTPLKMNAGSKSIRQTKKRYQKVGIYKPSFVRGKIRGIKSMAKWRRESRARRRRNIAW